MDNEIKLFDDTSGEIVLSIAKAHDLFIVNDPDSSSYTYFSKDEAIMIGQWLIKQAG